MQNIDPVEPVLGVDCTEVIEAYEAIERPALEAYEAIRRPAWEAYQADLLELDDPLVTWIAQNALPYHREEATEIYTGTNTLSLHDALPIYRAARVGGVRGHPAARVGGVPGHPEIGRAHV